MSDFLLQLGRNPQARKLIKSIGLPLPLPSELRRAKGPYEEQPLRDQSVLLSAPGKPHWLEALANTLAAAGANTQLLGLEEIPEAFVQAGEAYGRPARLITSEEALTADALIIDASGLESTAEMHALHSFFQPRLKGLARCGRVIVMGRPPEEMGSLAGAACQCALDGFVRALAKEVGRRGATAQLVMLEAGAGERLEGVLRFLLSPRAAFISGQPWRVNSLAKAPSKAPAELPWLRPLDGKTALVTGAARGIGRSTARLLAAEGAHVVCLDRPADDELLAGVARAVGGSMLLVDVSSPDASQRIVEKLGERGGVDIVVHNAGITRDKTLARMDEKLWDQTLDINLGAVIRITEALLQGTLRDEGRLVYLSSVAGIAGNIGQTNYAASKAGIIGLVEHLAGRVAERGITVNAIAPGFIETRLTAAIPAMIREAGRRLSNLGQGGLPQDVAEAITFLATPGSYGVSGAVLRVCGGAMIGA